MSLPLGGWLPSSLPGYKVDVDPERNSIVSGGLVTDIASFGTLATAFSQAVVAGQPAFNTAQFNGQRTHRYDGVLNALRGLPHVVLSTNTTTYLVATPLTVPATTAGFWGGQNIIMGINVTGATKKWGLFMTGGCASANTLVANTRYVLTSVIRAANDVDLYTGASKETIATATAFPGDSQTAIGALNGGGALAGNFDFGRLLVYAAVHDAPTIAKVQRALANQYTVTL